MPARHMTGL